MEKDKKGKKVICPSCNGNGYIRIPYHLAREGEIDESTLDTIIVDADGLHRLQ